MDLDSFKHVFWFAPCVGQHWDPLDPTAPEVRISAEDDGDHGLLARNSDVSDLDPGGPGGSSSLPASCCA